MGTSLIFLLILVGIALLFIGVWNSFMRKKNRVHNASASLDAILKKRYDLIPNLTEVVKGYAAYEQAVLESVLKCETKR